MDDIVEWEFEGDGLADWEGRGGEDRVGGIGFGFGVVIGRERLS